MISTIRLIFLLNLICFLKAGGLWQLDSLITTALEGANQHPGLDYTMETISLAAPCIEWGFTLSLHNGAGRDGKTDRQEFAQRATAGLVLTQLGACLLKYTVNRERPTRRYEPRLWNTRITPSFPSGHAASSAVFASIAARQYPAAKPLIAAYVLASAYSQVYVGNHYALDVLGGLIFGGVLGNWILGTLDADNSTPAVISIYMTL
ncbi:phosphatase PAP2 family protein [Candidatus Neomarinimicrobiota bacterium]